MIHARADYNRIQDPAVEHPELLTPGATPFAVDEPVFLLRAQDRTAAAVVRYWAELNSRLPDGDHRACNLAIEHAKKMDAWPHKKTADV